MRLARCCRPRGRRIVESSASSGSGQQTPAHTAALAGDAEALQQELTKAAGSTKGRNPDGCTPLHLAARAASPRCVEALLAAGADRAAVDHRGWTALMEAAWVQGGEKAMRVLLDSRGGSQADILGAELDGVSSIDHSDRDGWTALHAAAYRGNLENFMMLTMAGARLQAVDNAGQSAGLVASLQGHQHIVAALAARGEFIDAPAGGLGVVPGSGSGGGGGLELLSTPKPPPAKQRPKSAQRSVRPASARKPRPDSARRVGSEASDSLFDGEDGAENSFLTKTLSAMDSAHDAHANSESAVTAGGSTHRDDSEALLQQAAALPTNRFEQQAAAGRGGLSVAGGPRRDVEEDRLIDGTLCQLDDLLGDLDEVTQHLSTHTHAHAPRTHSPTHVSSKGEFRGMIGAMRFC